MTKIRGRHFTDLDATVEIMKKHEWKLLAGSTSNCCDHYDVVGVGVTLDGIIVFILEGTHIGKVFIVPYEMVLTEEGILVMGN